MTQRLISHREILETTREQLSTLPEWCRGQGLNLRRLGLQPSALPG